MNEELSRRLQEADAKAPASDYAAAFQELSQRANVLNEMLNALEQRLAVALNPPTEINSTDKSPEKVTPVLLSGVMVVTAKLNNSINKVADISKRLVI